MKTWKKIVTTVAVIAVVAGGVCAFCFLKNAERIKYSSADTESNYVAKVQSMDIFENDLESALPQTEIYNIIKAHFESDLPEGKTEKKAVVIGYDGCRLDVLTDVKDSNGAANYLLENGGKAYISYCGGEKYPAENTQATSTAPGWCSMLTGQWADVNGITKNGIVKSNEHLTLLTSLVEEETIDSSAFYVSWKGHFSRKKATYNNEVDYAKENALDVTFDCSKNDDGTKASVLSDVKAADCSDFIFCIFEHCDHTGHKKGYYTEIDAYREAFKSADAYAMEIINAVTARDTYANEDWLIIITSDHGGIVKNHGGASIQERDTFIVSNKSADGV